MYTTDENWWETDGIAIRIDKSIEIPWFIEWHSCILVMYDFNANSMQIPLKDIQFVWTVFEHMEIHMEMIE